MSVFVNNGDIYIIGAKEDAIVDVYTIDGVKIVSTTGNRIANLQGRDIRATSNDLNMKKSVLL